jgi:hypothetical protein
MLHQVQLVYYRFAVQSTQHPAPINKPNHCAQSNIQALTVKHL